MKEVENKNEELINEQNNLNLLMQQELKDAVGDGSRKAINEGYAAWGISRTSKILA